MVHVKLNEKYSNEFLTTHSGYVFYRKHNTLGRDENIIDIDLNNFEAAALLQQGVLKLVKEDEVLLAQNNEAIKKKCEKGVRTPDGEQHVEVKKDNVFKQDESSLKASNKALGLEQEGSHD
jgi:hypothetical protein